MARISRIVAVGQPHHVVQRGNRRQDVFFNDDDRRKYIKFLLDESEKAGVKYWAYCLMSNHVHLIAVPEHEDSLARGIGEAHRKYTRHINFREGWRGYLWQGRFSSCPLDEKHLYAAIRYVENNPVRAGIVSKAEDYEWSSARSHVSGGKDKLVAENFLSDEVKDWAGYLSESDEKNDLNLLRKLSKTGRPLGDDKFLNNLEKITGRALRKRKPGPRGN